MSLFENLKKQVQNSQVWKSIFRHDYKDTQRNRFLQIRYQRRRPFCEPKG